MKMEKNFTTTLNALPGELLLFVSGLALYIALAGFPFYWFLSGTPILTSLLLVGAASMSHIPYIFPLWVNFVYAICSTSWLLYWAFTIACYPIVLLVGIYQLQFVGGAVRRSIRRALRELHITGDKIALFNVPALEIDTEVDGLLVIRGISISLLSLTIVASGIEVGIKLSDDLELAIQTNKCTIRLFRTIEVDDVYANLKGGEFEMSFGKIASHTDDAAGHDLMNTNTPLLQAAASNSNLNLPEMKNHLTDGGTTPQSTTAEQGAKAIKTLSPDDENAIWQYDKAIAEIEQTSKINECERKVKRSITSISSDTSHQTFDHRNHNDMRAAICSALHSTPSVPHPPRQSVKVTTLQNLSPPHVRRFLHRLPFLLRLLLWPLSYLHVIRIASLTAAGSGKWIEYMLDQQVFGNYPEHDSDLRKLKARISGWLTDSNFVVEIGGIHALAQVPINSSYNIEAQIRLNDIMAYRANRDEMNLKQVLRIRGASGEVSIPSFLLPHHEHLLPPVPTKEDEYAGQKEVEEAASRVEERVAEVGLKHIRKDETTIGISARVRLPATFDQELLDWIAALVKATKLVEMDKEPAAMEEYKEKEKHGLKELTKALHISMKDGMKRVAVDAVANDRWIAKLVGKVTKKLETAKGDVGYSDDLPVALKPYRDLAEPASKLLP